ncbi:MAG: putative aminohydrolase SsnA [Caldilineaceae bacterium]|nr:putative aminohydrolase SsnA [Caldilineaceae bacterium]
MIIHNATVVTFDDEQRILSDGAVRVVDGLIDALGASVELLSLYPDDERWNADGLLLMPGQICAHTHFYGAFARGMYIPGPAAKDFPEILERLWWPLDRALDLDGVACSAQVCLVDAIRNGTTTLIDHHASQRAIDGSLDVIAHAVDESGLRAALCYEVTDRDGPDAADAGIRENVRFAKRLAAARRQSPASPLSTRLASLFGMHASLTLSDTTLTSCVEAADGQSGFHIHVAEHPVDEYDSVAKSGKRVVERLHDFGVAGPDSLLAHCIHIDAWEMALLRESGSFVSHQPRSNMNNGVGAADVTAMLRGGIAVCLGNDGFSNDMFAEMKVADLLQKAMHSDPRYLGADKVVEMATGNNRRLAARLFHRPVGVIAPGAYADLILLDYHPTTPLTAANLPWHILFGVGGGHVHSTLVQGRVLMRNRELLTLDEGEIAARSRLAAAATWERFHAA